MELRNIGKSGLRVSVVGLGCNNFGGRLDTDATRRVVHRALDAGITLFDTADTYGNRGGSERQLGEVLGDRRKQIVLATKVGSPMNEAGTMSGGSRRHIVSAAEDSLRRLRTDWIDLYQLHRPDPLTPIEETLRAFEDLIGAGKVRYAGISNVSGWQVADAVWTGRQLGAAPIVSVQNEYNLFQRNAERDVAPALRHYGLGLLPYFPLAGGLLSGKYRQDAIPEGGRLSTPSGFTNRYFTDANWAVLEKLRTLCAERGRTLIELAFGWLLAHDVVPSVIAGATRPEQIDANAAAAGWTLDADEMKAVEAIIAGTVVK
jgi:aryl-alcohol dehydrogenase-like predicted oxidoreductase